MFTTFNNIEDNYWMADVLYQDVKSESLPERKLKIRSKTLDKTYEPKVSTALESTKDSRCGRKGKVQNSEK